MSELSLAYKMSTEAKTAAPRLLATPAHYLSLMTTARVCALESLTTSTKKKQNFRVTLVDRGAKDREKSRTTGKVRFLLLLSNLKSYTIAEQAIFEIHKQLPS